MGARGWGALPWTHERFLPVQRTGCSSVLVDGVLSHGLMSDSYLRSAQDARGWGALPCAHERFLPVPRTGCSWVLDNHINHIRTDTTKFNARLPTISIKQHISVHNVACLTIILANIHHDRVHRSLC